MPDKYGFNILVDWGRIYVQCIEDNCDTGGNMGEWTEERRKVHFLSHNYLMKGDSPLIEGEKRTDNCRICGNSFEQKRRRGRPRVLCYICKPEGGAIP